MEDNIHIEDEEELISDETGNGNNLRCEDHWNKLIAARHSIIPIDKIPHIGMMFESDDQAHKFYNAYAREAGFSVRKDAAHRDSKGKVLDRIFFCSCQGERKDDKRNAAVKKPRAHTRTGCLAMMKTSARQKGKYEVMKFFAPHNHDLVEPQDSHLLRSHRSITNSQIFQIDDIYDSGIAPKSGFEFIARQAGGRENVGFTFEDYKNYLRSKKAMQMKIGDTGGVLEYLQQRKAEDPNFIFALHVDLDGLIASIFWVDAQMRADFVHFGDVVSFDTTYKKIKDARPLALFVGVNHHKQTIVFGAALLFDETTPTFEWLFETFQKTMSGKSPQTILTDQDKSMSSALKNKWGKTNHRLCIWHIYQNAATHLSHVFARYKHFEKVFSSCVYDHDEEDDFVRAWENMLQTYGLQTNGWLESLYAIKEKWAPVYGRQMFCGDLTTTQRSESMNSALKKYVCYKHNILQFFHHFQRMVDYRRHEEHTADIRTNHSTPDLPFPVALLIHAVSVYTREVFELFKEELRKAHDSIMEPCNGIAEVSEYKVTLHGRYRTQNVTYNSSTGEIFCNCKKFLFVGILCAHSLKVLTSRNITRIPEMYIKKRWTRNAKEGLAEAYSLAPHAQLVNSEKGLLH